MGLASIDWYHGSLVLTILDHPCKFTNDGIEAVDTRLVELCADEELVRGRHLPPPAAVFNQCKVQHFSESDKPDELNEGGGLKFKRGTNSKAGHDA